MAHVFLLYAAADHRFAYQLATQIEQRGMVIWPVPDPDLPPDPTFDTMDGLATASHVLGLIPVDAAALAELTPLCVRALEQDKHVTAILRQSATIPDHLKDCPVVDFEGQFLMAFEELCGVLKKARVPTRPLTVEHPPPVAKVGLLPIRLPAERCWRDDRLSINYRLPLLLSAEEMEMRMPAFLAAFDFDLDHSSGKRIRGRRKRKQFPLFDPRNAEHTLTFRRRKGRAQIYYRMTRMQVFYWFPAHYRVLDREAAALFRYLATGQLAGLREPVERQAQRARIVTWGGIVAFWLLIVLVALLIFWL